MNASTNTSRLVVQALLDTGVQHIVIAPGSRSAGLAFAAAQAHQAGKVRVHVRIDEREAGFLALGLAKYERRPTAVIVTSGTAVANLMPAIVEAHMSGVPLIAVTADRPASLRFSGAAQTINQAPMFHPYVAAAVDAPCADVTATALRAALIAATGPRCQPVHLNIQFDLPLMPEPHDVTWTPQLSSPIVQSAESPAPSTMTLPPRGVMIVGDVNDPNHAAAAGHLAARLGWPLLWEPSSNAHGALTALSHGPLIAAHMPIPDAVVTVGTVGLSRSVVGLLRDTPHHIAVHLPSNGPMQPDPARTAREILDAIPQAECVVDPQWLASWKRADRAAATVIEAQLPPMHLTGPSVAIDVWRHAPADSLLMVGASWPVRHLEAFAAAGAGTRIVGNRGANGIDGLVSTATGLALAHGRRTYLLCGDISFLYGAAGLLGARDAHLTVIVIDNDGSGIFSQLEQGRPEFADHFESVFGTPHGLDLWVVAESLGAAACRVTNRAELNSALTRTDALPGLHVIVCTTHNRSDEAAMLKSIGQDIAAAVTRL